MTLTWQDLHVYEVMNCWFARHRYAPSMRDLARACGYKSVLTIAYHYGNLQRAGLVSRVRVRGRAFWLVGMR